jgi:hypothetical protein
MCRCSAWSRSFVLARKQRGLRALHLDHSCAPAELAAIEERSRMNNPGRDQPNPGKTVNGQPKIDQPQPHRGQYSVARRTESPSNSGGFTSGERTPRDGVNPRPPFCGLSRQATHKVRPETASQIAPRAFPACLSGSREIVRNSCSSRFIRQPAGRVRERTDGHGTEHRPPSSSVIVCSASPARHFASRTTLRRIHRVRSARRPPVPRVGVPDRRILCAEPTEPQR